MTWNVENFFLPGGTIGVTDKQLFKKKVANLTEMIEQHNPDVLGLQEVGDVGALDRLKAELGTRYLHVLVASHFETMHPIRTAALLRRGVRPTDTDEIVAFPAGTLSDVPQASGLLNTMGRGALVFTATVGADTARFVVMHLKSKLLTYPGNRFSPNDEDERARAGGYALFRRAGEAVAVRAYVDKWLNDHPSRNVVAMGDLNDGPDAATTQILYGPPDANLARTDKGDPWRLVNLARFALADPPPFSRTYKKHGEFIDHILVSTDLARRDVTLEIDTTHVTTIGDQPSQRKNAVWPDHAPVVATIV